MAEAWKMVVGGLAWMKDNDLPNCIVLAFTGIMWPLVIYAYSRRKISCVPHLVVSLRECVMNIGGNDYPAIAITFLNNTGSVVYITNARLLKCSSLFQVPVDATRDIASSSHELQFLGCNEKTLTKRQITLQTNETTVTSIALRSVNEGLFSYRPPQKGIKMAEVLPPRVCGDERRQEVQRVYCLLNLVTLEEFLYRLFDFFNQYSVMQFS
jgi:hypothetical protein